MPPGLATAARSLSCRGAVGTRLLSASSQVAASEWQERPEAGAWERAGVGGCRAGLQSGGRDAAPGGTLRISGDRRLAWVLGAGAGAGTRGRLLCSCDRTAR